ncbi:OsmC family protein [Haloplanus pelagicus]|uniref:OsmC family protein n=1 Tax=Haloplanus pelagicus TaxID=2949995 RepID=UPI002040B251|nr:OsmC family protein [Haloplanus sp. HW8-1]
MTDSDLRETQKPLKATYEEDPEAARITLTATGDERANATSCRVEVGEAVYEAQLHEGAGGSGTAACSGDLLLGALAACSQLTAQAVIENLGADAEVSVGVEGDLDLRGTMGVADVPVGFQDIRLDVTLSGDLDPETAASIRDATERYCVVYRTLVESPGVATEWTFEESAEDEI